MMVMISTKEGLRITLGFTMSFHLRAAGLVGAAVMLAVLLSSRFMVIRVSENSMAPTLVDGQFVLVLRGARRVRAGDVAVFVNPVDEGLAVKRCVLEGDDPALVRRGWLVTPWGNWFLTGPQWRRLDEGKRAFDKSVFMVGDNQFASMDSRSYGFVGRERLIGRVLIRRNHG